MTEVEILEDVANQAGTGYAEFTIKYFHKFSNLKVVGVNDFFGFNLDDLYGQFKQDDLEQAMAVIEDMDVNKLPALFADFLKSNQIEPAGWEGFINLEKNVDALFEFGKKTHVCPGKLEEAHTFFRRASWLKPNHQEAKSLYDQTATTLDYGHRVRLESLFTQRALLCSRINLPSFNWKIALREAYMRAVYDYFRSEESSKLDKLGLAETFELLKNGGIAKYFDDKKGGDEEATKKEDKKKMINGAKVFYYVLELVRDDKQMSKEVLKSINEMAVEDNEIEKDSDDVEKLSRKLADDQRIENFLKWLNEQMRKNDIDPVTLASMAKFFIIFAQVFIDRNNRTSRALMQFVLMKAGFPPVLICTEDATQLQKYSDCLVFAQFTDIRPFIRFITDKVSDTVNKLKFGFELPEDQQDAAAPATSALSASDGSRSTASTIQSVEQGQDGSSGDAGTGTPALSSSDGGRSTIQSVEQGQDGSSGDAGTGTQAFSGSGGSVSTAKSLEQGRDGSSGNSYFGYSPPQAFAADGSMLIEQDSQMVDDRKETEKQSPAPSLGSSAGSSWPKTKMARVGSAAACALSPPPATGSELEAAEDSQSFSTHQPAQQQLDYSFSSVKKTTTTFSGQKAPTNFAALMLDALGTDFSDEHGLPIFEFEHPPPRQQRGECTAKPVNWGQLILDALGGELSVQKLPIFDFEH